MPWYFLSFIALFSASLYALSKKWALNLNISRERLLLFLFWGSFFFYLIFNLNNLGYLFSREDIWFLISWGLVIAALSMAGNFLDTYAMQKSPNPSYGTSLKSADAILIAIGSYLFFDASLSFSKIIGMVVISLGFLPLLFSKGENDKHWKWPSISAIFVFTAMILLVKFISNHGFNPQEILLVLFFFASLGYSVVNFFTKPTSKPQKLIWLALLATIIFSFIFNLANFTAIQIAPNAGYPEAFVNAAVVLTMVVSRKIFPEEQGGDFNLIRWVGVILIVVGIILIVL